MIIFRSQNMLSTKTIVTNAESFEKSAVEVSFG